MKNYFSLREKLDPKADLGAWIADFIKSDAPQFAGKSAEERKKMATAAYYAAQKKEGWDKTTQSADKKPENYTDKDGKQRTRMVSTDKEVVKEQAEKHRVLVTLSDPLHSMASQRKEKIQKHVRVSADSKETAQKKAKDHYVKRGYKVHDTEHVGMVKEETEITEDQLIEMYISEEDAYEGEGSTCSDQLAYIKYAAEDLLDMIEDEEDESEIDEWTKEKLNKIFTDMYELYEYLSAEDEDKEGEEDNE